MDDIFKTDIFEGIDKDFLNKLETTIASMEGKSDIEIIGTFMALTNEANQLGINMSSEQQQALMMFLRNSLPTEKRKKFDMILSMMGVK